MKKTILFIDGRNFLHKIKSIINLEEENIDFSKYNFSGLINNALSDIRVDKKIFYFGKITEHPETIEMSKKLIGKQRLLKTHLERQGFEVVLAGKVRGHQEGEVLIFREKGTDVKIAVDMISMACDGKIDTAIIGSSDSDLQPAVKELEKRKVKRIYLGFEYNINKGLRYTTDQSIFITSKQVKNFRNK